MSKQLTINQWREVIKIYNENEILDAVSLYSEIKQNKLSGISLKNLKTRIKIKAKLVDNLDMNKLKKMKSPGRPKKRDDSYIPAIIDELNDKQMREIVEDWIKQQRDKKDKERLDNISSLSKPL